MTRKPTSEAEGILIGALVGGTMWGLLYIGIRLLTRGLS